MATVKFYLRRPKENGRLKTSEVSIFLKFSIDKENRFELVTFEKISPVYWNFKRQEVKPNFTGHIEINQHLSDIKKSILQLWRDNKSLSVEALRELARPRVKFGTAQAPEKKSLFPILQYFINQYNKDKDKKTAAKFKTLKAKLEAFNKDLSIEDLDNNFYDRFKDDLFDAGLLDSTVYKTFTNLSTFLTWADSRGYEIHYTKGKPTHLSWEIINRRNEPLTLTMGELEKLETLQINEDILKEKFPEMAPHNRRNSLPALVRARDMFILECRTCQRISDLKTFNLKDVIDGVWHNTVTKGNRLHIRKVRIPFNTKFTAPAWAILQKYKFQIPEISEQKLNKNIKTVCILAGIDEEITEYRWKRNERVEIKGPKYAFISTHTGRKTFITLALQFMKPKLVKDLAGISWKTLAHYEGQSEDQNLIDGLNSIPTIMKTA